MSEARAHRSCRIFLSHLSLPSCAPVLRSRLPVPPGAPNAPREAVSFPVRRDPRVVGRRADFRVGLCVPVTLRISLRSPARGSPAALPCTVAPRTGSSDRGDRFAGETPTGRANRASGAAGSPASTALKTPPSPRPRLAASLPVQDRSASAPLPPLPRIRGTGRLMECCARHARLARGKTLRRVALGLKAASDSEMRFRTL